jgi:galactokinase
MIRGFAERLQSAGMSEAAALARARLFRRAAGALPAGARGPRRAVAFFVPGRIEVLGKHTDYAGGRSLLCTVERGVCLIADARADDVVTIADAGWGSEARFVLDPALVPSPGDWANYPMTVARRLARNFPGARCGADIAFASDLPPAAGMSSSSVLMIAVFFALAACNDIESTAEYAANIATPEDLAGYLATVENGQDFRGLAGDRGVGTFGGSEDHTAILCCQPGELSQYRFCPVVHERNIPVPAGCTFVIGVSGLNAEKTGAARETYNRASRLASVLLERWRGATGRADGSLAAAVGSNPDAADQLRRILSGASPAEFPVDQLLDRLDQFVEESERIVPAVGDAFARGDLESIGPGVDRSQQLAERLLGNQIPETVFLARAARGAGAIAASAFGAGFGGSVWALVAAADADTFAEEWAARYRQQFPSVAAQATFFSSPAGIPAIQLAG